MIQIFLNYKNSDQLIFIIVAFIIAIVVAMCSHEYSHAKTAYLCGDDTALVMGRMSLRPSRHFDLLGILCFILVGFGWAKPVPINPLKFKDYRKGIFLTSVAGIATNFVICFFSCGLWIMFYGLLATIQTATFLYYTVLLLSYTFYYLTVVNFSLCLFNLLPIYPLDGLNILCSVTKGTNKFVSFMKQYGSFILIFIFLTGIFEIGMNYAVNFVLSPISDFWSKIILGGAI